AERHQPGQAGQPQYHRGAGGDRDRGPIHAAPGVVTGSVASAAATWATVSHGCGASTLATCGANAAEAATTSEVGPSATTSPSANSTPRSASAATNSTSWVDTTTARPVWASRRTTAPNRSLAR